jgi:hypothetical protein
MSFNHEAVAVERALEDLQDLFQRLDSDDKEQELCDSIESFRNEMFSKYGVATTRGESETEYEDDISEELGLLSSATADSEESDIEKRLLYYRDPDPD